jgi:hypothetical protein
MRSFVPRDSRTNRFNVVTHWSKRYVGVLIAGALAEQSGIHEEHT